jgi:hypothetical protein
VKGACARACRRRHGRSAGGAGVIGEAGIFITGGRRSATLTAVEETTPPSAKLLC